MTFGDVCIFRIATFSNRAHIGEVLVMSADNGLKDAITRSHNVIVQSLDPNMILTFLLSEEVLTSLDAEIVGAQVTDNAKCAKIMAIVHKKGISDASIYQRFMDALNQAEESYGRKVNFIIERILSARKDGAKRPNWSTPRSEEQKFVWLHNRHVIAESLDVSVVIDWLISEGVVDHVEAEDISAGDTMVTQAKRLLKVVERKGAEGYVKFREALDQFGYTKLASSLSTSDNNDTGMCLSVFVCVCVYICMSWCCTCNIVIIHSIKYSSLFSNEFLRDIL